LENPWAFGIPIGLGLKTWGKGIIPLVSWGSGIGFLVLKLELSLIGWSWC